MHSAFRTFARLAAALAVFTAVLMRVSEAAAETPRGHSLDASSDPVAFRIGLRSLALAGRGEDVRAAVTARLAEEPAEAEKAALLELLAVADAWSEHGSPERIEGEALGNPVDWNEALIAARAELVHGAYASALAHLDRLKENAPSIAAAARAVELRAIALAASHSHPRVAVREEAPDPKDAVAKEEPAAFEKRWYGWQTLITDGVALTIAPLAPLAGLGTYVAGGPVVHLANGRPGIAAASLGLRVGAPVGGLLLGVAFAELTCSNCSRGDLGGLAYAVYGGIGMVAGGITAVAFDAAVLGREKIPVAPRKTATRFTPTAAPRHDGGVDFGVVGTW